MTWKSFNKSKINYATINFEIGIKTLMKSKLRTLRTDHTKLIRNNYFFKLLKFFHILALLYCILDVRAKFQTQFTKYRKRKEILKNIKKKIVFLRI